MVIGSQTKRCTGCGHLLGDHVIEIIDLYNCGSYHPGCEPRPILDANGKTDLDTAEKIFQSLK